MTTPALEVRGLTRTYGCGPTAVPALRGIDLAFAPGTFTALMGPSGSGKTTFLSCAGALEAPDGGRVFVDGLDVTSLGETAATKLRRARIGFIFQDFHLLPYLTAAQNVGLPVRLAGRRPRAEWTWELLAHVGLADRAGHLPGQLSGGQQQRVAIARALVTEPAVILADEPTGALDSGTAQAMLALLRSTVDRLHSTIVMVTHDPVAAAHADSVVFLVDGRIAGRMANPTSAAVAAQLAHLDELVGVR
jgi:putative ABC transport system ATP-binding protein